MLRTTARWIVSATAGIIVTSGLASGAAQAVGGLPGTDTLTGATGGGTLGGVMDMANAQGVTGMLPAGQ